MPMMSASPRSATVPLALVAYQRRYRASLVVSPLLDLGFTVSERPFGTDLGTFAREMKPAMVVLVADARTREAVAGIDHIARFTSVPLIVFSASGQATGAELHRAGADLVIHEAESPELAAARLGAIWRRYDQDRGTRQGSLTLDGLSIDFARCAVRLGERLIPVSPTEFRILVMLAENAGRVVSPEELMQAVHSRPISDKESRDSAKVFIRRLRQKMGYEDGEPGVISTVRGFGYVLDTAGVPATTPGTR